MTSGQASEISFIQCLATCAANSEFVEHWQRLTGNKLPVGVIDQMIDDATGHSMALASEFVSFVHETVWLRVRT